MQFKPIMRFVGNENYRANKFNQDGSYFWIMQFGFNKTLV
jgi:hypothetical protein